ncbi:hypothetical protein OG455_39865 [Kitasatospora sp. NBC_01287]|uniref:hypothetical protein n=1 Tax=Kitasatospora sp. NBC_01287 TaxID=2903573 RepID=UPI002252DA67|nr:hypothetical protein [Kitasatospora sp. NBC_01287]MCX4751594.1 hypothetical protein [Kitasatospora sp. NBC_01287]
MPARYHLRFQLHPTPQAAAQAAELAEFCREAGVDEVVLLLGAEEFYAGHPVGAAEDRLYETAATASAVLRAAGLEVSLNPWVTAGHADRGRVDRLGFTPMVGPAGEVAATQASFACPRWRSWLTAHYARFAALGFRVLWLEDDFRYHNHAPLTWGGGFEEPMLERLARLVGAPVTREQVVAAITAPGPPHPWRALLQQVWRTAQLEVAALVAEAVATHSGRRSQLGLMSSEVGVASVEGRDWPALFAALSIDGRVSHRPHFARYGDAPGRELSFSVWMLEVQRALRPAGVPSEPEIENWPHTAWSKSDTQTWSELVTAQLAGSAAMFLNVHPMQSGRAQRFAPVAELLRRSRPALDLIAERQAGEPATHGVGLAVRQDAAAHVRTRPGPSAGGAAGGGDPAALAALAALAELAAFAELAVDPGAAADYLLRYGVPVTAAGGAPVRVLFGQLARAFDDTEIRAMLAGGLLLDGTAARVLTERGFGELLGVEVAEVVDREQPVAPGPYALERVLPVPGAAGIGVGAAGIEAGVHLSINNQPALARLAPRPGAEEWTEILTPEQHRWGAGRCVFRNRLGGRVAVLAATAPDLLPYDDDGQRLLHATVRFLEGDRPTLPLVTGGPHLIPHLSRTADGWRLAIANGSADPARPRVALPGARPAETGLPAVTDLRADTACLAGAADPEATLLAPLDKPAAARVTRTGHRLELDQDLPHRGWLVLDWR